MPELLHDLGNLVHLGCLGLCRLGRFYLVIRWYQKILGQGGRALFSQSVITNNVPVLAVWKSRLFWALKWQQAKRVPFGPKKSVGTENRDFFGPWNGNERNGCCPHQNNYVQRHINNRYINSSSINTVVNWLTQWQSNDQETRRKVWRRRY